jgi:predicted HTH domain antitoxin
VALDLYKDKKVSLGYCASVADMTKEEFIQFLSMNGISIFSFESEDEFMEELTNA